MKEPFIHESITIDEAERLIKHYEDNGYRAVRSLINAAIKHVFAGTKDENILNQLQNFF